MCPLDKNVVMFVPPSRPGTALFDHSHLLGNARRLSRTLTRRSGQNPFAPVPNPKNEKREENTERKETSFPYIRRHVTWSEIENGRKGSPMSHRTIALWYGLAGLLTVALMLFIGRSLERRPSRGPRGGGDS